jgi:ABC-type Fe3+/spermidine/putrescine transport system ATPase subunit
VWPATVRRRVFQGDFTQYHVEWDGRTLVVRGVTVDPVDESQTVYLTVEPRHCVLLEDQTAG